LECRGGEQVERVARGRRGTKEQGALAEIVQHQRRQYRDEPCNADGPLAEMPHVRIERLATGDAKDDGAQREESCKAVVPEECERVPGLAAASTCGAARMDRMPASQS
jgi:hypothetical protein